ncbi:MAG: hypothetical protein OJJ54_09655 [Pseudonocardia sp.]|nr:hypothetical protein [Pseudonocardia sp.]
MRTAPVSVRFPDIESATIEFRAVPAQPMDLRDYWAAEEPSGPASWAEVEELTGARRRRAGHTAALLCGGIGALVGLGVWTLLDAGLFPL